MGLLTRYGILSAGGAALCLLRSGVYGYFEAGGGSVLEIAPPANYFLGLGSLLAGIAVVMLVIEIKYSQTKSEEQKSGPRPVTMIY